MGDTTTARVPFAGVLLDLYGTLVPAAPHVECAPHLHEMAGILGADPVVFERDWSGSFGDRVSGRLGSLEETIRRIAGRQGADPSREAVSQALDVRLAFSSIQLESCLPVLPGLDALRAAGVRLAVVSDCSEEAALLWRACPLAARIEATVFSCQHGFCKPDRRMYLRALERLGLRPEQCAFVGDGGSRELTGAEAVGIIAFRYRFPEESSGPDLRYDPDTEWRGVTLQDLGELLHLNPR